MGNSLENPLGQPLGPALRVLMVDHHTLIREGIRLLLNLQPDFEVVAEAAEGTTALQFARECQPDLVVLDLRLPDIDGLQVLAQIRQRLPDVKALVLTLEEDKQAFFQALRLGAAGYVLKGASSEELIHALRVIARGDIYLSPPLARVLVSDFLNGWQPSPSPAYRPAVEILSARELQVLRRLADGMTNAEIAADLYISISTVQTHRSRILEKLGLHTRADLVKYALRSGLVGLE